MVLEECHFQLPTTHYQLSAVTMMFPLIKELTELVGPIGQEAIVLDYLKRPTPETWVAGTVPLPVKQAILLMTAHLFEHRGDAMGGGNTSGEVDLTLWDAVGRLLMRLRDPALA